VTGPRKVREAGAICPVRRAERSRRWSGPWAASPGWWRSVNHGPFGIKNRGTAGQLAAEPAAVETRVRSCGL
jgi:hypothetical protein